LHLWNLKLYVRHLISRLLSDFAVKIGILGGISYALSVGVPTFVDPLTEPTRSRVYGVPSNYPLGSWILGLSVPVSLGICWINSRNLKASSKALLTSLACALAAILSLPNFSPFPNSGVWAPALSYSILLGLLALVHGYAPRSTSILKLDINLQAKIEGIKLEFELWFNTFVLLVTIIVIIASVTVFREFESAQVSFGGDLRAALWLSYGFEVAAAYGGVLLIALAWVMLNKLSDISEGLRRV